MEMAALKLDDWLGTLAHYLYVTELIAGRRVLALGCGNGVGCEFLASHGAVDVVGVDSRSDVVAEARLHRPLVNVAYHVSNHDALEWDDGCFELVIASGADDLRRTAVIHEIARVLARDGVLIWAAPSADRAGVIGGVSYYEFGDRLAEYFGPPRMIAVQPFPAVAFADYEGDQESVELDTSFAQLGSDDGTVTGYIAVFGARELEPRPYSIVQLPAVAGASYIGAELGIAATDAERLRGSVSEEKRRRDLAEAEVADLKIRVAELERDLARRQASPADSASARRPGLLGEALHSHAEYARDLELAVTEARELAAELEDDLAAGRERELEWKHQVEAERARSETMRSQIADWRDRAARAEGRVLELLSESAPPAGTATETATATATETATETASPAELAVPPSPAPAEVIELLDAALRALEDHRGVAAELEAALAIVGEDVRRSCDSLARPADRHELRAIATELGARDGDVTVLTIGLRSLQARIHELASELADAMKIRDDAALRERLGQLVGRLETLASG